MRRWLPRLLWTALGTLLALGSGCAGVKPWQREVLSHPGMQLEAGLGDGYRPHLLSIREGSGGADGGSGGGCGCN